MPIPESEPADRYTTGWPRVRRALSVAFQALLALAIVAWLITACAGCSWFNDAPPAVESKADSKLHASQDRLLVAAQQEVRLGREVARELPASPASEVVTHNLTRADDLLAQAHGPLPAADSAKLADIASGLLTAERDRRLAAERDLAAMRVEADKLSRANTALTADAESARVKFRAWAMDRDADARTWTRIKWGAALLAAGYVGVNWILPAALRLLTPGSPAAAALGWFARLLGRITAPTLSGTLDTVVTGLDRAKAALLPESRAAVETDLSRAMDRDHKALVRLYRRPTTQA